jgi:predicted ATPase
VRPELPSGTVTFLFTDIEGSTRLLHDLGAERYAEALAEHRRIVRAACVQRDGVEVDTQGDAFFFAFPSAPAAVEAAGSLTDALADGPIQLRVGLHTGTPLVTDEGYVGDDVHLAARIAAAGHGGQVVCSDATAKLVEFPLTALGEHRLKDIAHPVAIYQLGNGSFPPLKTISNTNLPWAASPFLGREAELEAIRETVEAGVRLLTLTGPGGSGKTRLAIEVATALLPHFKAGVFWVPLAALRDAALVWPAVGSVLGARGSLAEHIGERDMLLLLDNMEQVIEAAADLPPLLEACPGLVVFVTSREVMRVRGESEFVVPPMAGDEAVSLFVQLSGLPASAEISELCRRLDNLPLAVELAAARTRAMSPAQILGRLGQRLDLLKGGRDADPRQVTLRATIEWSFELLSASEQALLARLSVFAGGFTLEAAEVVAGADIDQLQSLVEKSLLQFADERYSMLQTVREYAAERLAGRGEDEQYRRRHFARYVELAEELAGEVWDARHVTVMGTYERDLDNMRAALGWARDQAEPRALLRLVVAMADFWHASDYLREGRRWLEEALARTADEATPARAKALLHAAGMAILLGDATGGRQRATEAYAAHRSLGDSTGAAHALVRIGNADEALGENGQIAQTYSEALALVREGGDSRMIAVVLTNVGGRALADGRLDDALTAYREAAELFESLGNGRGRAVSLIASAEICLRAGRPDDAVEPLIEAGRTYRDFGSRVWTAPYLESVAELASLDAQSALALRLLGAAQRLREDTGTPAGPHGRGESVRSRAADSLDEQQTATLLDEGRGLAAEQAIDEAIDFLAARRR